MRRNSTAFLTMGALALTSIAGVYGPAARASASTSTTPIVVGGDGDLTISAGVDKGFIAGIYRFNKAGGLNGRKIKFVGFLDDSFSAQTNLTNAQQLVQNKRVTVVAPFLSEVGTSATGDYLQQQKVPFIGWAVNSAFTTSPQWGWGINGLQINPNAQGVSGALQMLKITGNTKTPAKMKVALIAENIAGGIEANGALAGAFRYAKATVVYQKAPIAIIGTTNYAPYAQAIISSGANVAYEALDSADSVGLAGALRSAGFKGTIANGVTYFPGQLASQPNEAAALSGVIVQDEFPPDEVKSAATKQAIKDLVATGQPPYLTSGVSVGYWSAILLEQMLRAALVKVGNKPNKVTGAVLGAMIKKGFTYSDPIAGGIGTEYFPAAESIPTGCSATLKTTGTTFKLLTPYQCAGAVNISKKKLYNQKTGK